MAPTATSSLSGVATTATPPPTAAAVAIAICQFVPDDHAAVLALFQEGMLAYADHSANEGSLAYIQRSMETDLADIPGAFIHPGGNFWVAIATDRETGKTEVVGMVALEKKANDGDGELRRMSVKKEFRRFGVGKLLVAELERWAKTNGFNRVTLSTGQVMLAAQKFYLAAGFTQTETIVVCEEPYYADVRFVKRL
ncbi:N-acetyltransferase cml2 [Globisporangium polare]